MHVEIDQVCGKSSERVVVIALLGWALPRRYRWIGIVAGCVVVAGFLAGYAIASGAP